MNIYSYTNNSKVRIIVILCKAAYNITETRFYLGKRGIRNESINLIINYNSVTIRITKNIIFNNI